MPLTNRGDYSKCSFMTFSRLFTFLMFTVSFCANAQNDFLTTPNHSFSNTSISKYNNASVWNNEFDESNLHLTQANMKYVHPLTKVGRVLTFVGAPLMILGGVMMATADELYYECVNGYCDGDPKGGFGVLFFAAGTGLTATGVTLWTIGSTRK